MKKKFMRDLIIGFFLTSSVITAAENVVITDEFLENILQAARSVQQTEHVDRSTVLVGLTGSGKSLVYNILVGNNIISRQHNRGLDRFYYYELVDPLVGQLMGNPDTANSTTMAIRNYDVEQIRIWDTPGFGHHEVGQESQAGICQRLINAYSVRNIVRNSDQVRFLVCLEYSDILRRGGATINLLSNQLESMFGQISVYCGLIATKTGFPDTHPRLVRAQQIAGDILRFANNTLFAQIPFERIASVQQATVADQAPHQILRGDFLDIIHNTPHGQFQGENIRMPSDPELMAIIHRIRHDWDERIQTFSRDLGGACREYIEEQQPQGNPRCLDLLREISISLGQPVGADYSLGVRQLANGDYLLPDSGVANFLARINDRNLIDRLGKLKLIRDFVADFVQFQRRGETLRDSILDIVTDGIRDSATALHGGVILGIRHQLVDVRRHIQQGIDGLFQIENVADTLESINPFFEVVSANPTTFMEAVELLTTLIRISGSAVALNFNNQKIAAAFNYLSRLNQFVNQEDSYPRNSIGNAIDGVRASLFQKYRIVAEEVVNRICRADTVAASIGQEGYRNFLDNIHAGRHAQDILQAWQSIITDANRAFFRNFNETRQNLVTIRRAFQRMETLRGLLPGNYLLEEESRILQSVPDIHLILIGKFVPWLNSLQASKIFRRSFTRTCNVEEFREIYTRETTYNEYRKYHPILHNPEMLVREEEYSREYGHQYYNPGNGADAFD